MLIKDRLLKFYGKCDTLIIFNSFFLGFDINVAF